MTGSGSVTTTVTVPPVSADFDILNFVATYQVQLPKKEKEKVKKDNVVEFGLKVLNKSTVNGSAPATLVGTQNGVQVYSQTITVSAPAGGTATFTFPPYTPTASGPINWAVTITDPTPDTARAITIVED